MKKYLLTFLAAFLLLTTPVSAHFSGWYGSTKTEFRTALKTKKLVLKKSKVGKTTLYYDSKLSKKRVKLVKKWIRQLPSKVQRSAKKVYFLRKSMYMKTGDKAIRNTLGYEIVPYKEIYFYNVSDTDDLRNTLWHEFGHAWDSRKSQFKLSSTKAWKSIIRVQYASSKNYEEWFADLFAEYFEFMSEPENAYIAKVLKAK